MTKKTDEVKKQPKKQNEEVTKKTVKKTTTKKVTPAKKVTTKKVEKNEKEETKKEIEVTKEVKVDEQNKEESSLKSLIELIIIIIAIIIILVFFPNTVIWNIVILLLILTALIFVHEFGHFMIGKMCGVHIYEFALGMGPKVLGFKRKNDPTEYNLRALPIGGYCSLAGEDGAEDDQNLPKDKFMCNKGKLQRAAILVAGVTMNFITAFILLFFISLVWGSTEQTSYIGYIEPGSPADKAGMRVGDKIIECNGYKLSTWDKLTIVTSLENKNDYYEYVVKHEDGKEEKYQIVPEEYAVIGDESIKITAENTIDDIAKVKKINKNEVETSKLIGIGANTEVRHGFVNALKYACKKFVSLISTMLLIIGSLFTGKLGLNSLSGPVGMYSVVNTVAAYGLSNIIYFAAYISINLGIMNILPFPAFDGGRVVFVAIEAITGKKVDSKIEGILNSIGFILIMLLMVYVTWHDILSLFLK